MHLIHLNNQSLYNGCLLDIYSYMQMTNTVFFVHFIISIFLFGIKALQ